ncbi:MAG: fumarate reductase subunit C [Alphaproteobacteria bacterium]
MSRKPYVRPIPKTSWFMRQGRYKRYMAREVTCLFIGAYTAVLTVGLMRLAESEAAYNAFLTALKAPGSILFHVVAFLFAVYHSSTWFNVTHQAMPIQRGDEFVAPGVIVGTHYAIWAVVSLVVLLVAGV